MSTKSHIHVVGVGGVGMSALAELLLAQGCDVSGSDRTVDQGGQSEIIETLKAAGLRIVPQDGSSITADTKALCVSTAIEADNPEFVAAQKLGVEVVHRAAMLARLAAGKRVIAITGTAGKTTVTALVGYLLEQAGFDPTVVNGGVILNWRAPNRLGNVRLGHSDLWIIEADESDRSLLQFHPEHAIITNISKDHFELQEVQELFRQFAAQVSGSIISGAGVGKVIGRSTVEAPINVERGKDGWGFTFAGVPFAPLMPGWHNAENAKLAVVLCHKLGADLAAVQSALARFGGVHRRLEMLGRLHGARVIDDYAHNPAKIAASWLAAAESSDRVLAYWRPHGFAPLALMHEELVEALSGVMRSRDRLFVLPVYYAGGTAKRTMDSADFVAALTARNLSVELVVDYPALRARLEAEADVDAVILGMGARDPELPRFAASLVFTP
ncbi:MAG: Mur ligase domain-containing protein [Kiritimatiellae bacterium]|nr:Mur ligase domain-containing protein [Kiritimatiellia bacterium]